jgi:heptosyltransferase-3
MHAARSSRVVLLQDAGACVPCRPECCDRRVDSYSDCLQQLPAARVIEAIGQLLEPPTA